MPLFHLFWLPRQAYPETNESSNTQFPWLRFSQSYTEKTLSQCHTPHSLTPGFCILGPLVTRCTKHCKFIRITRNTAQKTHSTYGWSERNNDSGAPEIPLDTCPSFFVGYQLNRTQLGQSIELPPTRGPDIKSSALGLACWSGGYESARQCRGQGFYS